MKRYDLITTREAVEILSYSDVNTVYATWYTGMKRQEIPFEKLKDPVSEAVRSNRISIEIYKNQ